MNNTKKDVIRRQILTLLRNQKEEDRLTKSVLIQDRLFQTDVFQKAEDVLFYAAFDGEVETLPMVTQAIQLNKKVSLPVVNKESKTILPIRVEHIETDLETGPYGIQQPKLKENHLLQPSSPDLVIVPGVAFDRQNNRLGRGQGYYDRFLQSLPTSTLTIGLAFDFQLVEHLPITDGQDMPVSHVITN